MSESTKKTEQEAIDDVIEALQVIKYYRKKYASSEEALARIGQVARLLRNSIDEKAENTSANRVYSNFVEVIGKTWGVDTEIKPGRTVL